EKDLTTDKLARALAELDIGFEDPGRAAEFVFAVQAPEQERDPPDPGFFEHEADAGMAIADAGQHDGAHQFRHEPHREIGDRHQRLIARFEPRRADADLARAAARIGVQIDRDAGLRGGGPDRFPALVHDRLGIDAVAVHVLAAISGAGGAKDAGLGLLVETGARVAIDRAAPDTAPADAAPRVALNDPLPRAIRAGDDSRRVILKTPRQTLCPEVKGQVHQPAMAVRRHDAKPLFHRASSLLRRRLSAAGWSLPLARGRAGEKKIRANPLIFLDSDSEM